MVSLWVSIIDSIKSIENSDDDTALMDIHPDILNVTHERAPFSDPISLTTETYHRRGRPFIMGRRCFRINGGSLRIQCSATLPVTRQLCLKFTGRWFPDPERCFLMEYGSTFALVRRRLGRRTRGRCFLSVLKYGHAGIIDDRESPTLHSDWQVARATFAEALESQLVGVLGKKD
jgi:hypothetical protein